MPPLDRSWREGVRGPSYLLFLLSLQIHGQQQEFPPFPLILCAVSNDLYVFWPFVLLIQLLLLLLLLLLSLSSIRLPLPKSKRDISTGPCFFLSRRRLNDATIKNNTPLHSASFLLLPPERTRTPSLGRNVKRRAY